MWAGGNRWTRIAGLTASKPSSTAELRQTTRVPSALFTVFAASAGFDVLGELGDKLADGVDGQLTERERAKGRHEALAPGDLVAGPGAGLQVRTAPGKPPLPIAAEGLPGMPHLAALDLLDQPAPGVARGSLAREAPLRGLSPVAATVYESPARTVASPVRVHTPTAPVAGGIGTAGGGGDLGERVVERSRSLLGREPAGTATPRCIAPADFPAPSVKARAHEYVQAVVAHARWTYRVDVFVMRQHYVHQRTDATRRPIKRKSPVTRGLFDAPERTRTSTDQSVHKALNLARLPIPPQAREAASIAPGRPRASC